MLDVAPPGSFFRPPDRYPIIDKLRVLAIVCVTAHHIITATGHERWPPLLSLGDLGIGIFCAISGYLAFHQRETALPPAQWLGRRLWRVYPAFWIVMAVSFGLAAVTRYKTFTLSQVGVQLAGLGYFVYGIDALVNQATWFVSLILLCYLLAFAAKVAGRPAIAFIAVMAAAIALIVLVPIARPAAVFVLVFTLAGLAALWPVKLPAGPSMKPIVWTSGFVYEYFLVHGIFIVAAIKVVPDHPVWAASTLGVTGAVIAALALRWTMGRLVPRQN